MHKDVIMKFLEVQALVLAPICPHWSEYVWMEVLGNTTIQHASWPVFSAPMDPAIEASAAYLNDVISRIRAAEDLKAKKIAKKGKKEDLPSGPRQLVLHIAGKYPDWQETTIGYLKQALKNKDGVFDGSEMTSLASSGMLKDKRVMPFVASLKVILFTLSIIWKRSYANEGMSSFERALVYDEMDTATRNTTYFRRELILSNVVSVKIVVAGDDVIAYPGVPAYELVSV